MLELNKLSKIYNKNKKNELQVLNEVDFSLDRGKLIAIVGPSGSGKSTLLNIIGCMDKATTGKYLLDGINISELSQGQLGKIRNKYFGFVVQDFALIEDYTVFQNVEIPIQYSNNKKNKKERILDVLKKLEIEDKVEEYVCNLSGGQRQRVAIARAIVNNPEIILADEPTGALDQKTGNQVMEIFKEIHQKEKKTILIITHNMQIAEQCEEIYEMVDGNLAQLS